MTHKTSSRPIPQPPDLTHMFIYAWKMEEISFFFITLIYSSWKFLNYISITSAYDHFAIQSQFYCKYQGQWMFCVQFSQQTMKNGSCNSHFFFPGEISWPLNYTVKHKTKKEIASTLLFFSCVCYYLLPFLLCRIIIETVILCYVKYMYIICHNRIAFILSFSILKGYITRWNNYTLYCL